MLLSQLLTHQRLSIFIDADLHPFGIPNAGARTLAWFRILRFDAKAKLTSTTHAGHQITHGKFACTTIARGLGTIDQGWQILPQGESFFFAIIELDGIAN